MPVMAALRGGSVRQIACADAELQPALSLPGRSLPRHPVQYAVVIRMNPQGIRIVRYGFIVAACLRIEIPPIAPLRAQLLIALRLFPDMM